jgi:deoxycytidylate deaminase
VIGPCAKRRVVATLVTKDNEAYTAENLCANPQPVCPRLPGEGYEKCETVCGSLGHAEERAIQMAKRFKPIMSTLEGSTVFVTHHYACKGCSALCESNGIAVVCTAPVDSERTPNQ